jgi:hypothetical protein|tara:strand:+ start:4743 stop:5285 length:543 start_codon:yes stop_codon:yes gene_type:complete
MPITTYYDPKIKNYVSGWSPKKSEKNEDETLSTMFNLTKDNPGKVLSAGAGGLKRYVQGDEDTRNLVNEYAKDVGAGALKGGLAGAATKNPWAALAGAAGGAVYGGYSSVDDQIEERRAEEERLRAEAAASDAARLAAESQVSNQRLAGASQGQDSYMSQHYAYQPAKGYDDWYSTIFGA